MTVQLSVAVRNAMLDAIETTIGTSAIVRFRSGAQPADCAAGDSGTVIATFNLASDWMAAASAGSKAFSGTPITDASADAAGTLGHYRVYDSGGTVCGMQGSVGTGADDIVVDNDSVALGQEVRITAWTIDMSGHA